MAGHRMTPARRAALRKAQAASARKRRGRGKAKPTKNKRNLRTFSAEQKRRSKLAKQYKGPGSIHKSYRDYGRSSGFYQNNAYGNRVSKGRRAFRRGVQIYSHTNPLVATVHAGSYARGVRRGTIAKPHPIRKVTRRTKPVARKVKRSARKAWG